MAASSSRIFVRGLPPSLTESEFRLHFSKRYAVTDVKLFQRRRIGYVGFKTAADALAAVKYFNKTFIRMSKIGVEIAQPYESHKLQPEETKTSPATTNGQTMSSSEPYEQSHLKRKREESDPQLQEFLRLMRPPSQSKSHTNLEAHLVDESGLNNGNSELPSHGSVMKDSSVPLKLQPDTIKERLPTIPVAMENGGEASVQEQGSSLEAVSSNENDAPKDESKKEETVNVVGAATSDSDWMRSRTSRLLGLLDDEDDAGPDMERRCKDDPQSNDESHDTPKSNGRTPHKDASQEDPQFEISDQKEDHGLSTVRSSSRLFIRNLPYDVEEESLTETFGSVGEIEGIHIPYDSAKHTTKGFAYVQYSNPDDAVTAYRKFDGSIFQGRLLHVLPAKPKRDPNLDEFALSKLPLKKRKEIQRKLDASQSTFNWNSMYMNPDAVVSSIADKLGIPKSELLDPTSADSAVKQAQAETHIIRDTKTYFESQGVNLKAFGKRQRSDTVILVKNFKYGTKEEDLRRLFEDYGDIRRIIMPPSGTIAIVELSHAAQAHAAFGGLAYRKIGSSVLFLEKAPKDIFISSVQNLGDSSRFNSVEPKISASDLMQDANDRESIDTSTLYVKNLSFATTNEQFRNNFQALGGLVSARVKTKADGRSAGFGFLEFRSSETAQAALDAMNGYTLDGHRLEMKASNKGLDAAEERRKADATKAKKNRKSKIIIKNLPFEASKKDVRNLFKTYGQLRAVRVPKKFDNTTKGFAFAEFTTPREAESAMDALRHVHFLGRRLNMEYASGERDDPEKEIEKMQQRVGRQSNSIAIQQLKDSGRKKFNVNDTNEDEIDE